MSWQATEVIAKTVVENPHKSGFKCFCGEWFSGRAPFDEHLMSHPGMYVVCDCCKRVLPKGSWTLDENGNFVSVPEHTKGTRQASPGSTGM